MIYLVIIIPKLGLQEQTDSDLGTYAEEKITKINLEPAFAAVDPSTATVKTKNDAYKIALGKVLDGTTANTADKDTLRGQLQELLTLQANDCALISAGNMVLFLKSGYEAKDVAGSPVGELDAPENILFRNYGKNQGELVPDWTGVEHARNYTVQVYTDPANPDTSVVKEVIVNPSKATIGGLTRGANVWVRVRANGGPTGHGPWSDPANKIVP
ncbi:MAG: fibronectin type III domain-containing protein [Bacteroidia bacterium]